eukprot:Pgem_evm1s230
MDLYCINYGTIYCVFYECKTTEKHYTVEGCCCCLCSRYHNTNQQHNDKYIQVNKQISHLPKSKTRTNRINHKHIQHPYGKIKVTTETLKSKNKPETVPVTPQDNQTEKLSKNKMTTAINTLQNNEKQLRKRLQKQQQQR